MKMKGEFLNKENIMPRELHSWGQVNYGEDFLKTLLNSFPDDYKRRYELEGKIEEIKDSIEENQRKFVSFLLRILEVVDFWERILEDEANTQNKKIGKFISVYQFLIDELAKGGVKPDGPELGELPRKGKDVVEGTEKRDELPEGVICNLIKKCYLYGDRVLRKARVITVKKGG